jgi:hypothetical protein
MFWEDLSIGLCPNVTLETINRSFTRLLRELMLPSATPGGSSPMRAQFQRMLEELESTHRKIERQLEERIVRFTAPASVVDVDEFDAIITSFFWDLFCPELDRIKCWSEHRSYVSSMAFSLLEHDYGRQAKVRSFDLARSGNDGGLRQVLGQMSKRLLEELVQRHAQAVLSRYAETDPKTRIRDARDYLKVYGALLPSEMTDQNGVVVLEKFFRFLGQHATTVNEMRRLVRR